ncbi:MAG: histidine kinase [Bacteroidota bacterium]
MKNYFSRDIPYLGFNDFYFMLVGVPLIGFMMPVLFFGESLSQGFWSYGAEWLQATTYSITYWLGVRYILIAVRKQYPQFEDSVRRIILQIVIVLVYAFFVGRIMQFFLMPLFCLIKDEDQHNLTGAAGVYGIIFLMLAIYEAIYFYYQLKLSIQEREEAKQAQLRSELEGLRNQVNPHFLFNSLNTLMNIVAEDQKLAISFLKKLSKVYRYILESRGEQLISLKEEMDFMESYIFLLRERFQQNLQIDIDIPPSHLQHQVIPLALQILFENAIKHNILSAKRPLSIRLFVENDKLIVENGLQRKNKVLHSTRVGLENVRIRYKIFTDQRVEVMEDAHIFRVALPLLVYQHQNSLT